MQACNTISLKEVNAYAKNLHQASALLLQSHCDVTNTDTWRNKKNMTKLLHAKDLNLIKLYTTCLNFNYHTTFSFYFQKYVVNPPGWVCALF